MQALDFSSRERDHDIPGQSNMRSSSQNTQMASIATSVSSLLKNTLSIVWKGLVTQVETASDLLHDSRFRAPLISIYVATAGGALHDPVTTFFYLELGASTQQLGEIQALAFISAFLLAPIYGHVLDTYGSYFPLVISCFFCGLGCFIRCIAPDSTWLYISSIILGLGGGNLWTVTLSHLTVYTDEARKGLIVSSFVFQVTSLRILGKASYPLWNFFVENICGVTDKLLRYRIHMSTCTVMCLFGFVFTVFFDGDDLRKLKPTSDSKGIHKKIFTRKLEDGALGSSTIEEDNLGENDRLVASAGNTRSPLPRQTSTAKNANNNVEKEQKLKRISFVILLVALFLQSASKAASSTLWPLYLKSYFNFNPTSFSYLLLSSTVFSTLGISALPILGSLYGEKKTLIVILIFSVISSLLAFQFGGTPTTDDTTVSVKDALQSAKPHSQTPTLTVAMHTISSTVFFTSVAMMEPLVKSMVTIVSPSHYQGRVFSLMSIVSGVGSIISNIIATRMYSNDKILSFKGDAFTFFCLSTILTFGLVAVLFLPQKNQNWRS